VEESRGHRVPPEARGERLDHHLASIFPDLTRARLKRLIDSGRARVDGKPAKPARRLRGGESIELALPAPAPPKPLPEDLPLEFLYEDSDIIVVNKRAGMVVHPGAGHREGTLVNALLHRVRDLAGVGGELRPGIVHRLDKDTSGCLVAAKNDQALAGLQGAFKARRLTKTYLAIVHGAPPDRGTFSTLYGRHPVHRKRFTGRIRSGKPAETSFAVRERFEGAALLEVRLKTGRTHQIRVHLAEAGYPILGDELYGKRQGRTPAVTSVQRELGRQALHAWKLEFSHPRSGELLRCEAQVPNDFERALGALRGPQAI
jgi:23S rRNA pseudouridine1911/1915/1917 synthase